MGDRSTTSGVPKTISTYLLSNYQEQHECHQFYENLFLKSLTIECQILSTTATLKSQFLKLQFLKLQASSLCQLGNADLLWFVKHTN